MKKRSIALLTAMVLLAVGVIGGTLAWLTDDTQTVTNTFTTSEIEITLEETGMENNANSYQMIPGYDISKDPKVTVEEGSEKCYLFVKLTKENNFDSYLTYTIADGWTSLTGVEGVYFRIVDKDGMDKKISVLKDDKVTVNGSVTSEMMTTAKSSIPTLKVTAYASQYMKNATEYFTETEAWENISNPSGN